MIQIATGADEASFLRLTAGLSPHSDRYCQHQQCKPGQQNRFRKPGMQPGPQRCADDAGQTKQGGGIRFGLTIAQSRQPAAQRRRANRR